MFLPVSYTLSPSPSLSLFTFICSCHQFSNPLTAFTAHFFFFYLFKPSDCDSFCFFNSKPWQRSIHRAELQKKKGETALSPWNLWKAPSVNRQRHPLKKQHLLGRVKETLRGETASEAACGEASGIFLPHFTDFTE